MLTIEEINELNIKFENSKPEEVILFFSQMFDNKIALSSSLSAEDQVLIDMFVKINPNARIFTLDSGRLFPETYNLIDKTNQYYKINIEIYFPYYEEVEEMVQKYGINLFYDSIEKRRMCCHVRKLTPLYRAFQSLDAWICGLRTAQSVTRADVKLIELDNLNKIKINPLIKWNDNEVWNYINKHHVPYNVLHKKGYPSIGCQPCTRAILSGEDIRAGRWWWENPEHKECGLHR